MSQYLLAIDQGTTSSRAIVFDKTGKILSTSQQEFDQHYPQDGWVEHDAEDIWHGVLQVCRQAIQKAGISAAEIAGCGITNQRETTVLWDRATGKPLHNAIVWQDRRTAAYCRELAAAGHEPMVAEKTGLLLDPYFSGTKLRWLLENVNGARARAEKGELAFGTIDCWLLWKLTDGKVHATDASNASRTLLFNIREQSWDKDLLDLFEIPASLLPDVKDNCADFGSTAPMLLGAPIAIGGMAGDQQAALIGQACFKPGMLKSTYGTGCFVIQNIGSEAVLSKNRLLTTVAYRLDGKTTYGLEGSIFNAGTAVQWLRDALCLIDDARETEKLARSVETSGGVYLVPAFTGLGAPYWDPDARGAILGLTRDAGIAQITRAALESVCYQTRDLLEAMAADAVRPTRLRVDGGMVVNDWVVQRLADMLQTTVDRPEVIETTALGAAYLAGLQAGVYGSLDEISRLWACQQDFEPKMSASRANERYAGWKRAVERVRSNRQ
ncbi:MAG: glycerol kinase GlpK, partial [Nevskiales bacterium]